MIHQEALTDEQRKQGLAAAKGIGPREFALAVLAAKHGLRANELASIRMSDLDIVERKLRITPGKNSLKTTETLNPETCQALEAWLAIKPKSEYLFPQQRDASACLHRRQVYDIFVTIAKAANIPNASRAPHSWRHGVGQLLADNGVPVQDIARVLRHKSIASTMHYFKVTERRAAEVREKYL